GLARSLARADLLHLSSPHPTHRAVFDFHHVPEFAGAGDFAEGRQIFAGGELADDFGMRVLLAAHSNGVAFGAKPGHRHGRLERRRSTRAAAVGDELAKHFDDFARGPIARAGFEADRL